jgi:class 3 adenylate cyclase
LGEGTAADVADGERKTVTALFADLKGSTELMESLDPEEARAIVDPAVICGGICAVRNATAIIGRQQDSAIVAAPNCRRNAHCVDP